jgi:hypothetical protein
MVRAPVWGVNRERGTAGGGMAAWLFAGVGDAP